MGIWVNLGRLSTFIASLANQSGFVKLLIFRQNHYKTKSPPGVKKNFNSSYKFYMTHEGTVN